MLDPDDFVTWTYLISEAENHNTLPERLDVLSKINDDGVLWRVAHNPNTPIKTLELLATDNGWGVRCGVAYNPNTPKYIKQFIRYEDYLMSL